MKKSHNISNIKLVNKEKVISDIMRTKINVYEILKN